MKTDRTYLLHIRDAIGRIHAYTRDGREAFFADAKTQDAVIRNLEIVGEAVKRLSPTTTSRDPAIPWSQIAGMRDVLIHHYFGVKLEAVWNVVEFHLSPLSDSVEQRLTEMPPDGDVL